MCEGPLSSSELSLGSKATVIFACFDKSLQDDEGINGLFISEIIMNPQIGERTKEGVKGERTDERRRREE